MDDAEAKRIFIYDVKLCTASGKRASGWSQIIVTGSTNPSDLLRVARIAADHRPGINAEEWVGLDEAKLLYVGSLDPIIAV